MDTVLFSPRANGVSSIIPSRIGSSIGLVSTLYTLLVGSHKQILLIFQPILKSHVLLAITSIELLNYLGRMVIFVLMDSIWERKWENLRETEKCYLIKSKVVIRRWLHQPLYRICLRWILWKWVYVPVNFLFWLLDILLF